MPIVIFYVHTFIYVDTFKFVGKRQARSKWCIRVRELESLRFGKKKRMLIKRQW